jgi:hypothetical protein
MINVRDLKRDPDSQAIINTNPSQYEKILIERRKLKELQIIKKDIDVLKQNVELILSHLGLK